MTPERSALLEATPGWKWTDETRSRTRKHPQAPAETPTETEKVHQARRRSQLEELHKKYKTMNADTYASRITADEFADYHAIADAYDAKDPAERQPINKIASLLTKYNKSSYSAIDLGCGKNRLRKHELVSRMTWTSLDAHPVDSDVIKGDMGTLPFEEESFDFVILSRSLWARNHIDVMKEALRILKCGGRAVICESYQRWQSKDGTGVNELLRDLTSVGFIIDYQEGTGADDSDEVFQYIVARKAI